MPEETLQDKLGVAFADLEASIKKTWGDVPGEIAGELKVIADLINPPVEAPPAPDTGTPPEAQ